MRKPTVAVFTTGGTISSVYSSDADTIDPELSGEDLISIIRPHLHETEIELVDMGIKPGPHIYPDFVLKMSKMIKDMLKKEYIVGVVVTQGTDTVDENSFLFSLLIDSKKPVVITGAMKSENELYVDAVGNLSGAIKIAQSIQSRGKGVLVYFDEMIYSACDVEKHHANRIDAFISPKGSLGGVYNGEIKYNRQPLQEKVYDPKTLNQKVGLVKVCTGMDDLFIRTCIENHYSGIVIEGFGAGNVPPTIVGSIKEAIAKGIIVIVVSRCFDGEALGVYNYVGGGAQLASMGVLSGKGLSGQKARLKLMVLLGSGFDKEEIKKNY